ncbi:bifunctional Metalloenzyme [Babesia duncani]|uniref:Bifunctional Metalloenzyme n=1 Tax=Babesia duncani TaxID=323732 RepID=A0AAD9UNG9_9APIC|nr:bifunctional Metalloenzyme [Babesia duncani]
MNSNDDVLNLGFLPINSFSLKNVQINEFQSLRSGLKLFLMGYDSPIMNMYCVFPTQADNNEGLPHTLEHLIFLGSELYPHRGTLDVLACRSLSIGTNAWTSVDHTAYTISTAGIEGCLKILPVYLDHMLRPTLTQESFMTDVHHITANGSNSGVVYCEMKTNEETSDHLAYFEMMSHLYPKDSGYNKNYGGALEGLRSTDIHRVREYHSRFYRWDNLSIVLCGNVSDKRRIFNVIAKAEVEIGNFKIKNVPIPRMKCWDECRHVNGPTQSVNARITFPCDDEDVGNYMISWRGPHWNDFLRIYTINFMGVYLVESVTSPLHKTLIQKENIGSCVDFTMEILKESYYLISIKNVPCASPNKLDHVHDSLLSALMDVYNNSLDMQRMRMLIRRSHYSYLRDIELSPHETLIDNIIRYTIYGDDPKQLEHVLCPDEIVEELLEADEEFWLNVLLEDFIKPIHVTVTSVPSTERAKELQEKEENLIKQQLEMYGAETLLQNKKIVDDVTASNKGIPNHITDDFGFCDLSKISLNKYPILRNFNATAEECTTDYIKVKNVHVFNTKCNDKRELITSVAEKLNDVTIPMQINHIDSDFVELLLLFSIKHLNIDINEKRLLLLLCETIFESYVVIDEKEVTSDEFIIMLMDNTIDYGACLGLSGSITSMDSYSDLLSISITCHVSRYKEMYKLLMHLLQDIRYHEENVQSRIKSTMKSFKKSKRSAKCLIKQAFNVLRLKEDCVRSACSLAQQQNFFDSLLNEHVSFLLQALHKKLFTFDKMCLHVTADMSKLDSNWLQGWRIPILFNNNIMLKEHLSFEFGSNEKHSKSSGVVSYLASTDVCYFVHVVKAPLGYMHKDFCPLNVMSELLCMMEGSLFRAIRGGGFAYNFGIVYYPSRGELHLTIYQATAVIDAIKATMDIVRDIDGISEQDFISARSSMIFKILQNQETQADYCEASFMCSIRGTPIDFDQTMLDQVRQMTMKDLIRVWKQHLMQLLTFENQEKTLVCITPKGQYENVMEGLKELFKGEIHLKSPTEFLQLLANPHM